MTLQFYTSHKRVQAGKIQRVIVTDFGTKKRVNFVEVGGKQYDVPADFGARGVPEVGDWFIRYADGYLSWSPAAAFEEGYTLDGEPYQSQAQRLQEGGQPGEPPANTTASSSGPRSHSENSTGAPLSSPAGEPSQLASSGESSSSDGQQGEAGEA